MKGVVIIINKKKRLSMTVTYESGNQARQVPEWAVRQALHFVFGLEAADVSRFITMRHFKTNIRNGVRRAIKTWDDRSKIERTGATITGFAWLLAQDQPLLRAKAAPASRAVFEALGEEEWNRLCDQLDISYHERAEMLFAEDFYSLSSMTSSS